LRATGPEAEAGQAIGVRAIGGKEIEMPGLRPMTIAKVRRTSFSFPVAVAAVAVVVGREAATAADVVAWAVAERCCTTLSFWAAMS
jgi:hypothetical protein